MSGSVILAIDIGSSSIRCTAYDVSNQASHQYRFVASQSQSRRSVQPRTGQIVLANNDGTTMLDDIDVLVDQVLSQLQSASNNTYNVIAVGFSSFVMNLVGVDVHGQLLGDHATLSYACSRSEVNAEVKHLKRCV
jgi:sugar (pentulose or hexulose) kinase